MAYCFVIPDVHLKPWMFDRADEILKTKEFDYIVCLGDLVDDWHQQQNILLYEKTLNRCMRFALKHNNSLWCYGNHDVSYLWKRRETGYSETVQPIVSEKYASFKYMLDERLRVVHRIDDALFSHAGVTEEFVDEWFGSIKEDVDSVFSGIEDCGANELWRDNSPIWARPQEGFYKMYPENMMQIVGHSPVEQPLFVNNVLSLDTFSTYSDGSPIGNGRFVCVDTVKMTWVPLDV